MDSHADHEHDTGLKTHGQQELLARLYTLGR